MMPLKAPLQHLAIIMDGNGRWGKAQGKSRAYGHKKAIESVEMATKACLELSIPYLSLYAFSRANWQRPKAEVDFLMRLLAEFIEEKANLLFEKSIQVKVIGALDRLPKYCREKIDALTKQSIRAPKLSICLAIDYGGRWDMVQAIHRIAQEVQAGACSWKDITEATVNAYLSTSGIPDPDLLIRTGGEQRISDFFLWQLAYTELYITSVYWPAFGKEQLLEAIASYQQRERRFGKTSDQIQPLCSNHS